MASSAECTMPAKSGSAVKSFMRMEVSVELERSMSGLRDKDGWQDGWVEWGGGGRGNINVRARAGMILALCITFTFADVAAQVPAK